MLGAQARRGSPKVLVGWKLPRCPMFHPPRAGNHWSQNWFRIESVERTSLRWSSGLSAERGWEAECTPTSALCSCGPECLTQVPGQGAEGWGRRVTRGPVLPQGNPGHSTCIFCPLSDLLFLLLMPYVDFQKIIVVLKLSSSKIDFFGVHSNLNTYKFVWPPQLEYGMVTPRTPWWPPFTVVSSPSPSPLICSPSL